MNFEQLKGCSIRAAFEQFNSENPQIFKAFEEQVMLEISKGVKKLSAKFIINQLRWSKFLNSNDQDFKINDAFQSYYPRLFVEKHNEYSHIFDFRKQRNEEPRPYMSIDCNGQTSFL